MLGMISQLRSCLPCYLWLSLSTAWSLCSNSTRELHGDRPQRQGSFYNLLAGELV